MSLRHALAGLGTVALTTLLVLGTPATTAAQPAPSGPPPEVVLTGVTAISAGDAHTCALLNNGQVRCWGDNASGQLGNDQLGTDSAVPVAVRNPTDSANLAGVTQLDVGGNHSCARLSTGRAVCWGEGGQSQLGDAGGLDRDLPVVVRNAADTGELTGVAQVSAAGETSCAVLTNAQARCWGDNSQGQVGDGDAPADAFTAQVVRNAGDTGALSGVAEIDVGDLHTCARLTVGQVRCWGEGSQGRLGVGEISDHDLPVRVLGVSGPTLAGVTQMTAGFDHTCARLTSATVVCWGDNNVGEVGDGTVGPDNLRPGAVANPTGDGSLTGVSLVDAGASTTCARVAGGQLRCFGGNTTGELGTGTTGVEPLPVTTRNVGDTGPLSSVTVIGSGLNHRCVALASGQARCFGTNNTGQLGNDDAGTDADLPVVVGVP